MRNHSIEHIVRDAGILHRKYGADCINFADEGFLQNERRFVQLLKSIRNEGIQVTFRFSARIDILLRLHQETWELMKEYGVIGITTAPESGSQRMLNYMGKGITLGQIYKADALLTKYKMFKSFNILVCTPSETIEDLKATLLLLCNLAETSKYCPSPLGTLHKYIPLPETKMFEDAIAKGFKPPDKLEDWGYFDFEDVRGTRSIVRPWLLECDYDYIEMATALVEKLNNEFIGEGANEGLIDQRIRDIRSIID